MEEGTTMAVATTAIVVTEAHTPTPTLDPSQEEGHLAEEDQTVLILLLVQARCNWTKISVQGA
jgi:hypothetical protein